MDASSRIRRSASDRAGPFSAAIVTIFVAVSPHGVEIDISPSPPLRIVIVSESPGAASITVKTPLGYRNAPASRPGSAKVQPCAATLSP